MDAASIQPGIASPQSPPAPDRRDNNCEKPLIDSFTPGANRGSKSIGIDKVSEALLGKSPSDAFFSWFTPYHMPVNARVSPEGSTAIACQAGTGVCGIDMETGAEKWSKKEYFGEYGTAPLRGDGTLFIHSHEGVAAVNADTGEDKWRFDFPDRADRDRPVLSDRGVLIAGEWDVSRTENNRVFGLDSDTGKLLWELPLGGLPKFAATPAGDRLYVSGEGKNGSTTVLGLDLKTGRQVSRESIELSESHPPITSDAQGNLYIARDSRIHIFPGGKGRVIDLGEGNKVMRFSDASNDSIIIAQSGNKLHVIDRKTGSVKFEVPGIPWCDDVFLGPDGTIYAQSGVLGPFSAFDGETGKFKWGFQSGPHSQMTVSGSGKVYISERESAKERGKAHIFELNPGTGKTERIFMLDVDKYGCIDRIFAPEAKGSPVFVTTWKGVALFSSHGLAEKLESQPDKDKEQSIVLDGEYVVDIDGVKLEIRHQGKS